MHDRRAQVDAATRAAAAALLRRGLQSYLDGVAPAQKDTLLLLTSEVVTNAVQHGGGQIMVAVCPRPASVRVEVTDPGEPLPLHAESAPVDAERGRGLHVLDVLAASWGVTPAAAGGKTVWFEVAAASTTTNPTSPPGRVGGAGGAVPRCPVPLLRGPRLRGGVDR